MMNLLDQLLLQQVKRFSICHVNREQSVAEHSYNVVLISMWLVQNEDVELINNVIRYAIEHDMNEIKTGDIPSPFKRRLRAECPGVIRLLDGDHMFSDEVRSIVKMADCLEAIHYLVEFGGSRFATQEVLPDVRANFYSIVNASIVSGRIRVRAIELEKQL